jgi:hypothetical protein
MLHYIRLRLTLGWTNWSLVSSFDISLSNSSSSSSFSNSGWGYRLPTVDCTLLGKVLFGKEDKETTASSLFTTRARVHSTYAI